MEVAIVTSNESAGTANPPAELSAYTDLDRLADTWSAEEARAFAQRTKPFEMVDEELWR